MFENDYIMRQIESMSRILGELIFQKDNESGEIEVVDEHGNIQQGNLLLYQLKKMILEKRINEAENLLFEAIEKNPLEEYLKAALSFYGELLKLSDKELEACNFSRDEVLEGLQQIQQIYSNI